MLNPKLFLHTKICFLFNVSLLFFIELNAQYVQDGAKLVGANGSDYAHQGEASAISGDGNTAIVGGRSDDNNTGAAWIYTRIAGNWVQQGPKLVPNDEIIAACFGFSVSLSSDGNTAIIGGNIDNGGFGAAWIFTRKNGVWNQTQKLVGTGAVGNPNQGSSVAISGDGNTCVVGGCQDNIVPGNSNGNGAIWIFTKSGGIWSQQGSKLVGTESSNNALQGYSVAISYDGNTVITGGVSDYPDGAAWVFSRSNGVWSQQGSKLVGLGALDGGQGYSVGISGDGNTVIIGSNRDNGAWIFIRSGNLWGQQGSELVGSGAIGNFPRQGVSAALSYDGNIAVVGADLDDNLTGALWYFSRTNGAWFEQQKMVPNDAASPSYMGTSCSISYDGKFIITGGPGDRGVYRGSAWIFKNLPFEICPSGSVNFSSNLMGNKYQWQVSKGGAFLNITDNANYNGSKTIRLQLNNIPSNWSGYKYRCLVDGKYSSTITLKITSYWNGIIDDKWETGGNWSCGVVPDKYTDVYINANKPNYPQIRVNGAECKSLTLDPGTSLKVNAIQSLAVYGN